MARCCSQEALQRSLSEAGSGNARSPGSPLPLVSLIAVDGGALTRVSQWSSSSETALSCTVPTTSTESIASIMPTGYYILSVMTHGTAGGRVILVDGTPPAKPQVTTPLPSQGFYTTKRPEMVGYAEPGSTVKVKLDDATDGVEVAADESGAWNYTPSEPLKLGIHTISVTALYEAGNESASASVDFLVDLPRSHYGCASGPALPASGIWLVVLGGLRRRSRRSPTCPFGQ